MVEIRAFMGNQPNNLLQQAYIFFSFKEIQV